MSVRYEGNNKIIEQQDSETALTDAIANLMLCYDGDEDRLEEAIESAKGSAEIHFSAERDGDSEGFAVFVDRQDGSPLVDLRWHYKVWEGRRLLTTGSSRSDTVALLANRGDSRNADDYLRRAGSPGDMAIEVGGFTIECISNDN